MEEISKLNGAKWVGISRECIDSRKGNIPAYFRNVFKLNEPAKMKIAVSAHSRYKLWINGQRVAEGPCKGDKWRHYYEVLEVDSYLKTGINIIAAEVIYYPPAPYREKNRYGPVSVISNALGPWLIMKGECLDKGGNVLADITTGKAEWSVCLDDAICWDFNDPKAFMPIGAFESVNGGRLPLGWKTDPVPKGQWNKAITGWEADSRGWGEFSPLPLEERPIPLMACRHREFVRELESGDGKFESITFGTKDRVVLQPGTRAAVELDAGELATGYFILKTSGGKGSKVSIRYAESYSLPAVIQYPLKGVRDDSKNYRLLGYEDYYYPSGEDEVYEPFWFRTFRFVRIEAEVCGEPLILLKPGYDEVGYPLEAGTKIAADVEWIGSLWEISLRTLKRCMHETYEDCPYYEQMQYTLDTRLQALYTYAVSGDVRLARKAIEDFHSTLTPEGILQSRAPTDTPNIIPVFSLYWIFMLEDYYWQTGDLDTVKRYRPTIDAILDWFHRRIGPFGLTERYLYWEFTDWVEEWQDDKGYITAIHPACNKGPSATNNLVYAKALQCAGALMGKTGRKDVAAEYEERSAYILAQVQKYCWDDNAGMYREGPSVHQFTQHAQVWSVLTGLASGEKAKNLLENSIKKSGVDQCTIAYSFFLFRALEIAGLYHLTEELWGKWKAMLQYNLTTWPEDMVRQRSDCHGWSALPLYEFTRCILGVRPAEPGWRKITIKPLTAYVANIKGSVVTGRGNVEITLENGEGSFTVSGYVPEGVPFEVSMPDGEVVQYPNGGYFNVIGVINV